MLSYATYVGGTGGDIGYAIAVDANFDAYIAGVTNSTNFPTAGAPYQSSSKGNGDAFVTKVNYEGSALLYSTYLGGSGADSATALALGSGNQVFLTGNTTSSDFPMVAPQITPGVTTYPFQDTYGGNTDAFVAQIGATGSTLFYSSYLGGNGFDSGQGIAADASGNAYVVGQTQSANFPTVSPMQLANGGASDVFVAKVNTTGTALTYSTYLGGAAVDVGQSIQVDSSGDAYIAGYTFSGNFPTVNPYQKALAGASNAFVAELNPAGSALTFSTYVGGSANDSAFGVALDGSANVYITGSTQSSDFPTTSEASQTSIRGASNAFITKLNPSGSSLVYSTYLGGSGVDQGNAIWVSSAGVAYVTGFTQSSDFPTQNPIQAVLGITNNQLCGKNPCADAFVTLLDTVKNAVVYSTYLGGNGPDFGQGIAVDSTGDPYITGSTSSTNFPSTSPPNSVSITAAPYQSSLKGEAGNAFVAKIDSGDNPNISINPYSLSFGSETLSVTSPLQQIYIVNPSTEPLDITNIQVGEVSNSVTIFTETDNCVGTLPPGGGYCIMNVAFTPGVTGSETDNITITDNAGGVAGTEQNIAVSGTGVTAATAVTVLPTSLSFTSTPVGASSAAQNVTITNTGTLPLTISSITAGTTGDFSETSASCQALNNTLNVGQSCSISVVFSPTASGTRNASLSITDNATGSPQVVALTGIGAAAFQVNFLPSTCGNSTLTNPVIIGADQTTFCVVATGAPGVTGFTGAISLACSAGTTCAFTTNPIFVGSNTTMTVSQLTTTMPNPYNFTVTGVSGSQTASVQVPLEFEDYTLTVSPSTFVDQAGGVAKYTVNVNPLYGLVNQQILLQCNESAATWPPAATYTFNPSEPQPNWPTAASSTLNIQTQKYLAPTHVPMRLPKGPLPPIIFGLLSLAALASLAVGARRRARQGRFASFWLGVRLATLSVILALDLALAIGCRSPTLVITGTTTGNYTITISGTMVSNTNVVRYTTVQLDVTTCTGCGLN